MKANCRPEGDQAGELSMPGWLVTFWRSDPSRFEINRSVSPRSVVSEKSSLLPSGEMAGVEANELNMGKGRREPSTTEWTLISGFPVRKLTNTSFVLSGAHIGKRLIVLLCVKPTGAFPS